MTARSFSRGRRLRLRLLGFFAELGQQSVNNLLEVRLEQVAVEPLVSDHALMIDHQDAGPSVDAIELWDWVVSLCHGDQQFFDPIELPSGRQLVTLARKLFAVSPG